jgi:hypothetical protein
MTAKNRQCMPEGQAKSSSAHEAARKKANKMREKENSLPVDPYPLNQEREDQRPSLSASPGRQPRKSGGH